MKKIKYRELAMDDIHPEARNIAVAWIENYQPNNSIMPEIAQKVKLASDIMNFAIAYHEHQIEQLKQHGVMQGLAELSDEVLAEAFAILFDEEWKRYWPVKSKADGIRSIIKANDQPCRPFENWVRCIDFLMTQASPAVASEGQGEANTCADCGRPKDEDGTCYSCEYGAMFGH